MLSCIRPGLWPIVAHADVDIFLNPGYRDCSTSSPYTDHVDRAQQTEQGLQVNASISARVEDHVIHRIPALTRDPLNGKIFVVISPRSGGDPGVLKLSQKGEASRCQIFRNDVKRISQQAIVVDSSHLCTPHLKSVEADSTIHIRKKSTMTFEVEP